MLEFTCSTCGKRVQGDDASAGQHVLCPACNATMTAPQPTQADVSPASAIATPEHAPKAKVTPRTDSSAGSFSEGEPPRQYDSPRPPVGQEGQPSPFRGCAGGLLTGLIFAAIGFICGAFLSVAVLGAIDMADGNPGRMNPMRGGITRIVAICAGILSALVCGLLGLIAGAIAGPRDALVAAFTTGILGALIVAATVCIGGFLASAFTTTFAENLFFSMWGSFLDFIIGTIVGSLKAARIQTEKESLSSR